MWYLFLKGLQAFQKQDPKSERSYYAIAGIHGAISGTMSSIATAAFEPVFWLHHCNIDRLPAIHQAIQPSQYISDKGQELGTSGRNFVAKIGDVQNNKTHLKPLWRTAPAAADAVSAAKYDAVFWNSQQVENTEVFGYSYPETFDHLTVNDTKKFIAIVKAHADRLYPADITPRLFGGMFARMAVHESIMAQEPLIAAKMPVVTMIEESVAEAEASKAAEDAEAPAVAPEVAPEVVSEVAPEVAPLDIELLQTTTAPEVAPLQVKSQHPKSLPRSPNPPGTPPPSSPSATPTTTGPSTSAPPSTSSANRTKSSSLTGLLIQTVSNSISSFPPFSPRSAFYSSPVIKNPQNLPVIPNPHR